MEKYPTHPVIQTIQDPRLDPRGVTLSVLRLDLVHPDLSGNKWYKLKYNLRQARKEGYSTLLTFGGAYSNHIYATAAAGKIYKFRTVGIIRGERPPDLNPSLRFAERQGMQLHFISREAYRQKTSPSFLEELRQELGDFYMLPEGGANRLAVKGCTEILPEKAQFDVLSCSVGTGATLAGLLVQLNDKKRVLGFSALKGGSFLKSEIDALTQSYQNRTYRNYELVIDYHFGGFARANHTLIDFINEYYQMHGIPLEPIYTGKLFYGLYDLISQGYFASGTSIMAIHTGGLQGISGFNERHKTKKLRILGG